MEWIRLSVWAILIIAASVVAWVTTKGSITANAQEIAEASVERINIVEVNKIQNDNILTLQTDVTYIKKNIDELMVSQQDNTKLLYRILGSLKDG